MNMKRMAHVTFQCFRNVNICIVVFCVVTLISLDMGNDDSKENTASIYVRNFCTQLPDLCVITQQATLFKVCDILVTKQVMSICKRV
jgi:hypothetical protein